MIKSEKINSCRRFTSGMKRMVKIVINSHKIIDGVLGMSDHTQIPIQSSLVFQCKLDFRVTLYLSRRVTSLAKLIEFNNNSLPLANRRILISRTYFYERFTEPNSNLLLQNLLSRVNDDCQDRHHTVGSSIFQSRSIQQSDMATV